MSDELRVIEGGAEKPRAVLRTLTMVGFKSFSTRTVLEFAAGITAIVGPNGAGKTNCGEAIRWALGAGSGKMLRVKRGEDLIFAGSETRRAIGMSEVLLHLDNSSGRLPISFTEVELGRRLYRSGESEYLINRAKVRLRDLEDLLAGANLADNPFVHIGQGLVDQVLALRPSERRIVIEEAAGTRRLHLRRAESLAKLIAAEAELVRVNDVLREIGPRRMLLEEQAAKWLEYEAIRVELRRRALRWYRDSYGESARARDELRTRLVAVEAQLAAIAEEVARTEGAAVVGEEGLTRARGDEERTRLEAQSTQVADARAREELAALRSSLAGLREQHDAAVSAMATLPVEIAALGERMGKLEAEAAGSGDTARRAVGVLAEAERRLSQRQAVASAASAQRLAAEREGLLREGALSSARIQIAALQQREVELAEQAKALDTERLARSRERDGLAAAVERVRRDIDEASRRVEEDASAVGTLRGELFRIDGELAIARGKRTALEDALARAEEELALRTRALAAEVPTLPTGLWWLFERVRVPADVELAVRAALGGRVVVADALERAAGLRDAGLRDATIVAGPAAPAPRGISGTPLADALEYADADAATVARAILGGVYLVEQDRTALARAKDLPPGVRLVTRSGIAVERSQARIAADAVDELSARRRIAQVEDASSRLRRELETVRREVAELEQERERTASTLGEREAALTRAHAERSSKEAEAARISTAEAAVHDAVRSIEARLDALERERADLRARVSSATRELQTASATRADAAEALARVEGSERAALAELREAEASASRARLEAATGEERLGTLARLREALGDQLAAAERRRHVEEERIRGLAAHAAELEGRVGRAQVEAEAVGAKARAAQTAWDEARERALRAENVRRDSEQRAAQGRERLAELRGERSRFGAEEERANAALRLLDEQVRAELGLTDEDPLPDPASLDIAADEEGRSTQAEMRRLGQLRRRLIALEPVNPLAADELAAVAQRHDFLTGQKDDLDRAIADLRSLADELARTIAEQFSATLLAVDREFAAFFARLFNGGSASLRVAESEEGEEAGIDILARPPGKRVSSLSQLSGGERALTAVALLLAILRVKPAPFCVLDEVDAALDERNVGRFTQALRELTDRTQFVVITHNRGTIEAADALYGVSMDAQGVSKIVSLRLADLDKERVG